MSGHEPVTNPFQEADNFLNFLDEPDNTIIGISRGPSNTFTSSTALRRYLESENTLSSLIHTLLPVEDRVLEPDLILAEYVAVFSTLISIGQAHLLGRFVDGNFNDEKLPILDKPRRFPRGQEDEDIFDIFFNAQWRFCPLEFRKDKVGVFVEPEQILPVIQKEIVSKSEAVVTYKVVLHEDYDPFCEGSATSILKTSRSLSQPKHTYLFKEFSGRAAKALYEKELAAFLQLQKNGDVGKTIVNFYGSFVYEDSRTLILEYGDRGSLADFLELVQPPSTSEEVSTLWQALLQIQKGLHAIHALPRNNLQQTPEVQKYSVLRGWHQNITPSNIMVVGGKSHSPYDCQFRIANLATIEDTTAQPHVAKAMTPLSSTRAVYAAPELYREESAAALDLVGNQKTDVWSLGCLFSEFAVWMVLGSAKLEEYREDRRQETIIFDVKDSGCFHDGQAGLPCVRLWNAKAIENKRSSDHITKGILRQIVSEMLYDQGDARPTTTQLLTRASDIIQRAQMRQRPEPSRYTSIMTGSTGPRSTVSSAASRPRYPVINRHVSNRTDASGDLSRASSNSNRSEIQSQTGFSYSHSIMPDDSPTSGEESATSPMYPPLSTSVSKRSNITRHNMPLPQLPITPLSPARSSVGLSENGFQSDSKTDITTPPTSPPKPMNVKLADFPVPPHSASDGARTGDVPDTYQNIPQSRPTTSGSSRFGVASHAPVLAPLPPVPPLPVNLSPSDLNRQTTRAIWDIPEIFRGDDKEVLAERGPAIYRAESRASQEDSTARNYSTASSDVLPSPTLAVNPLQSQSGTIMVTRTTELSRGLSLSSNRESNARSSIYEGPDDVRAVTRVENSYTLMNRSASTTTRVSATSSYKPVLPFEVAYRFYDEKKSGANKKATLPDEKYLDVLSTPDREFLFLVDDAASMAPYADQVIRCVKLLTYLLKKYDKVGIDLRFMQAPNEYHARSGKSSDLHKHLETHMKMFQGQSNITQRLGMLLSDHVNRYLGAANFVQKTGGLNRQFYADNALRVKPLMIYVVTDGMWKPNCDIVPNIQSAATKLDAVGAKHNQLGVQFLRCGSHPALLEKLTHLKTGLGLQRPMIDTEPVDGNVFKMLLGSVSGMWDD